MSRRQQTTGRGGYDAFVSYSHDADGLFATRLHEQLERFAKPWNRPRALSVFLDKASLSADPGLWSSIVSRLERSTWLVLLASPQAAASPWVARELEWWLDRRTSADRMLLVVTAGSADWDGEAKAFTAGSTAIPPVIRAAFREVPLLVDARTAARAVSASEPAAATEGALAEVVAALAPTLHGRPREEMVGVAAREHRRTRRLTRAAIAVLSVLLLAALTATVLALDQRDEAVDQRRAAVARQLAAAAVNATATDLDVALRLAVKAFRSDPGPATRAALTAVTTASPHLVRFLPAGAAVTTIAGSADGGTVVAGLADGRVVRWASVAARPQTVQRFAAEVTDVAVGGDGDAVAATDGATARLWRAGRDAVALDPPAGFRPAAVAISPSGRTFAVRCTSETFGGGGTTLVGDVAAGTLRELEADGEPMLVTGAELVLVDDEELFAFDGGYGSWERIRLPDGELLGSSGAVLGTHQFGGMPSADGRFVTALNEVRTIPVWRTDRPIDQDRPARTAEAPVSRPTSAALSPDGARLAVADGGTIHVAETAKPGAPRPAPVTLTGLGDVTSRNLVFLGDGDRLLSATRETVAVWDLRQRDRLARTTSVAMRGACSGCGGAAVGVSPDGDTVAIVESSAGTVLLQPLRAGAGRPRRLHDAAFDFAYTVPAWTRDGHLLTLPLQALAGGSSVALPPAEGGNVRMWATASPGDGVLAAVGGDDGTIVVADARGAVHVHDADSGERRAGSPGPARLAHGEETLDGADLDATARFVALNEDGRVTVETLPGRELHAAIPGGGARHAVFAGARLLVQREDGTVEVWADRGRRRERTLGGDSSYSWRPVPDPSGRLLARLRQDGAVVLDDIAAGTRIATLQLPDGERVRKTGLAFSPDGSRLVTVIDPDPFTPGSRGLLIERDLSDEALVAAACRAAGRGLTAGEWRTFTASEPPDDLSCG